MKSHKIECCLHGLQDFALLCTHLAHSLLDQTKVGFHEYEEKDLGRPDAWCTSCEEQLKLVHTAKEQEQWFLHCDNKMLCVFCWDEAKELNAYS